MPGSPVILEKTPRHHSGADMIFADAMDFASVVQAGAAATGVLASGVAGAVINGWISHRKQRQDELTAESDRAAKSESATNAEWRQIVADLRADLKAHVERNDAAARENNEKIDALMKDHQSCLEKAAAASARIESQDKWSARQDEQIAKLNAQLSAMQQRESPP